MSVAASNRVWKTSKHIDAGLVLMLALADRADDDGIAFPGVDTLKVKIRKSERQTRRLISAAENSGELYIKRGVGKGNTSTYFITVGLSLDEIQEILKRRFQIPHLLALQESTAIFEKLKGVICDTKRKTRKVTSSDTLSNEPKGDIQGTQKVTFGDSKGDMHEFSQVALPPVPDSSNPELTSPTYVLHIIDTSDSIDTSLEVSITKSPLEEKPTEPEKSKTPHQLKFDAISTIYVLPGKSIKGFESIIGRTLSIIEEVIPDLTPDQAQSFADCWVRENKYASKTWDKGKIRAAAARWRNSLPAPPRFDENGMNLNELEPDPLYPGVYQLKGAR